MLGDNGRTIDEPDDAVIGEQREYTRRVVAGHRVANMWRATYSLICGDPQYVAACRVVVAVTCSDATYYRVDLEIIEQREDGIGSPIASHVGPRTDAAFQRTPLHLSVGFHVVVRGVEADVTEPGTNHRKIDAALEHPHRRRVSQRMWRDAQFGEAAIVAPRRGNASANQVRDAKSREVFSAPGYE